MHLIRFSFLMSQTERLLAPIKRHGLFQYSVEEFAATGPIELSPETIYGKPREQEAEKFIQEAL
jgi:hypothetical protein